MTLILFYSCFQNFWKLGVVFLFCESYCYWCFQKGVESKADYADFYELETNFYRALLRTSFSTAIFDITVLVLSWISFKVSRREKPKYFSFLALWKGLCLCRYAVLFELVPLIWSYANAQPRILIVSGIFIYSNLQSLQGNIFNWCDWTGLNRTLMSCFGSYFAVVTGLTWLQSLPVLLLASVLRHYVLRLYDGMLPV